MGSIINGFEDKSKTARHQKKDEREREMFCRVPPDINDVYIAHREGNDKMYIDPRDNQGTSFIAHNDSHEAMLQQTPRDHQDTVCLAPKDTRDPQTSANTMYRWAMWRMYLNEDMSRAISRAHAPNKMADRLASKSAKESAKKSRTQINENSVSSIASVYVRHRDAMAYGRMMKDLSIRNRRCDAMERTLPDNFYLVYGLPRVSVCNTPPKGVREIYASAEKLERHKQFSERGLEEKIDTDKCINKLFDFVTDEARHDYTHHEETKAIGLVSRTANGVGATQINTTQIKRVDDSNMSVQTIEPKRGEPRSESRGESRVLTRDSPHGSLRGSQRGNTDAASTADQTVSGNAPLPLVSKSRLFWEKLANSKSEIIQTARNEVKRDAPVAQSQGISGEVLLKQHQLLKKTKPKPRSSRDLWQTVRERKHDILQLRDWNPENESADGRRPDGRKRENKTSHLWGFIFSKKKELVQMKRNRTEHVHRDEHVSGRTRKSVNTNAKHDDMVPGNFQDNFQKELESRLRKFRDRAEQNA